MDTDVMNWQDEALCAQTDPDMFFPVDGSHGAKAIAVCDDCPVRVQCLEFALTNHITEGIFGGLPPRKRRNLKIKEQ